MRVSHITTKTSRFEGSEIVPAFSEMVKTCQPFTVWIDFIGNSFPSPVVNGVFVNAKIEESVRAVLRRTFGPDINFA